MATLDPKSLEAAKDHAKEIEKLLGSSAESVDVLNENFNLTVELLKKMRDTLGDSDEELIKFGNNILSNLTKETTIEGKILATKQAQSDILRQMVKSGISLVDSGGELSIQGKFLSSIMQQAAKAQAEQSSNFIRQVFFSERFNRNYAQAFGIAKKLPSHMTAAGNAMAKLPIIGSITSKVLTGLGSKLALMGVPVIGWITTAILLAVDLGKEILEVFKQADEAGTKFRMTVGFIRKNTVAIDEDARRIAIDFATVGATFDLAYNSVTAIMTTMGSLVGYSKGLVETGTIFAAQLGVSAEKSMVTLKAFAQISRSTMAAQRNMLGFVARLSQAGGTNLNEVMSDIAEFSQSNYRFMKGTTSELIKATVEARRMGTSLASVGKSANSLLNFTQSINDEMEASVLLGRSIDLQRARSLSYAGDLAGLNKEILRLAQAADFENMDPFQMQAFAKAVGLAESEISKMLVASRDQEEQNRLLAKDPSLKARVEEYRKILAASEKTTKNLGQQYLLDLQREANQTRMLAIQQQWTALTQKIAEEWLPVIDTMLKAIVPVINVISKAIQIAMKPITDLAKIYSGISKLMNTQNPEDYSKGWELAADGVKHHLLGSMTGVYDFIANLFKANSPHRLGQMYVDGFTKAAPLVEKSLTTSMTRAAASTADILSGMGLEPVGDNAPPGMGTIAPIAQRPKSVQDFSNMATDSTIMKVVDSINRLREDMLSGKLGANVRLDSQILAESTKRATDFRGGYGTNNARA